jgi:flavin reductase (DIM6/NTAB) family NADH-FMN oxidoreductase RutF
MELDLRAAMRHFATGVSVVSTFAAAPDAPGGVRHDAVTVNSLAPVSYDPPLVSLCLHNESALLADLLAAGRWGVSILGADGARTAALLARPRERRLEALATLPADRGTHTGALIFSGPGWLECALADSFAAGDHLMVIGEVLAAGVREPQEPLIFLQGTFTCGVAG